MAEHNPSRLLSLGLAAARLGIRPRDLRLAAERGEVPHVRIGERALLFDLDLLREELLERSRQRQHLDEPQP